MVRTITSHPSGRNYGLAVPAHADKSKQGLLFLLSSLEQERACSTQVSRGVESYFPALVVPRKLGSCVILAETRSLLWEVSEAAGKLCLWMGGCQGTRRGTSHSCRVWTIVCSPHNKKNVQRTWICFCKEKKEWLYWLNTQNTPGRKAWFHCTPHSPASFESSYQCWLVI